MNKKAVVFILIVIAVLAFAYWQLNYYLWPGGPEVPTLEQKLKTPQVPAQGGIIREPYVVEITDIGFKPSTLEINSGDTVKFVNRGNRDHWPASGVHPTHELCPGFDAFHGLIHNEEYSYTFNFKAPRICPVHDHLDPTLKGTVIIK